MVVLKLQLGIIFAVTFAYNQFENPCYNNGGNCLPEADCRNSASQRSGWCPLQPGNIKCCLPYQESACAAAGGTCERTDRCSGAVQSGKCPSQPANVKCCTSGEGSGALRTGSNNCGGNRLGRICDSNALRGTDCEGSGAYGAGRGNRKHKGIDIMCSNGNTVYAPFDGRIARTAAPYTDPAKRCMNEGLEMTGTGPWAGYSAKMFYVRLTVPVGRTVEKGQAIGTHLGLHCHYRSCMTDHVHFELSKNGELVDPTSCV